MPVPNSEPQTITAGETVQWTRSIPEYPAPTYTLKYALQAVGKTLITITATASGSDFAVSVTSTISADYAAGKYTFTAFVEAGSTRFVVGRGEMAILPSPLAALGTSHASRMLALIEAALEGRIPNGLEKTDIDGQMLERIPVNDLVKLQKEYQRKVIAETRAALGDAGLSVPNTIGIKFVRPR